MEPATKVTGVGWLVRCGVLIGVSALTVACSVIDGRGDGLPSGVPLGSSTSTTTAERRVDDPLARGTLPESFPEMDGARRQPAPQRDCARGGSDEAAGDPGPSPSALLVSGSGAPEPGDVPVHQQLERLGFGVTIVDDDLVSEADANGMDVVLISESSSSAAIGSTFTGLPVPLLVWERHMFPELKMSTTDNWHTDAQGTLFVSNRLLTCGVFGEVAVSSSDVHPMNRARPPDSATVFARRSPQSDEAVWFGYRTGDPLTDGTPAPAARVALWFTYELPTHTTAAGWELFALALEFAMESAVPAAPGTPSTTVPPNGTSEAAPPSTEPGSDPVPTDPGTDPSTPSPSPPAGPTTSAAPTRPPTATTTTSPTTAPSTTPAPSSPPSVTSTTSPTTTAPTTTIPTTKAPTTTTPTTTIPTTTAPLPTTTAPLPITTPTTTTPTTTTVLGTTTTELTGRPPGGGPPPWAPRP